MRMLSIVATLVAFSFHGVAFSQQSQSPATPDQPATYGSEAQQNAAQDQLDEGRQAQRSPQQRQAGFRGTAQGQPANEELINYLAAKMFLMNQCEIEAAQMAIDNGEHQKVVEFAKQLQQEHQQLNDQLTQAMPGLKQVEPVSFASANQQNQQARSQAGQAGTSGQREQFLDGAAQTLIDIQRRASEKNHEMVQEMLTQKQGADFDMGFVGHQIGTHMWMVSELSAIRDLGPQQFTSIVQQAEQSTEQHLERAKELAKALESQLKQEGQQGQLNLQGSNNRTRNN